MKYLLQYLHFAKPTFFTYKYQSFQYASHLFWALQSATSIYYSIKSFHSLHDRYRYKHKTHWSLSDYIYNLPFKPVLLPPPALIDDQYVVCVL